METENRLEKAALRLLGAAVSGPKIIPATFFMYYEDIFSKDSTTLMCYNFFEHQIDLLLLANDGLESLNCIANKVALAAEEKIQVHPFQKLIINPEQLLRNDPANNCNQPRPLSLLKAPNSRTSGEKKSVRFADSVGHNLEHVKLFHSHAEDAEDDIEFNHSLLSQSRRKRAFDPPLSASTAAAQRQLLERFVQRNMCNVSQITELRNVCIESISVTGMSVSGLVQIKNIAFEKKVRVRYSLDGWGTFADTPCFFSYSKLTNNHDVFCFSLCLPFDLPVGSCCEMCVCYSTSGQDFWDNNDGQNYKLECCSIQLHLDTCS